MPSQRNRDRGGEKEWIFTSLISLSLSDMNGVISKTVLPNIFFSKTAHVHLKAAPEVLKKSFTHKTELHQTDPK